jgi:hypothetical protein
VRVAGVAVSPRHAAALPIPGDLQRIDRIDLIARRDQRLHPRAAVGLDAEHHVSGILIIAEVLADQRRAAERSR